MKEYCCPSFKEMATGISSVGPAALASPTRNVSQFEYCESDQSWAINGCCGGQCFVVTGMKFCPFCGTLLQSPIDDHEPIHTN